MIAGNGPALVGGKPRFVKKGNLMASRISISCFLLVLIVITKSIRAEETGSIETDPKFQEAMNALSPVNEFVKTPVLQPASLDTSRLMQVAPKFSRNSKFSSEHILDLKYGLKTCWCSTPELADEHSKPLIFAKFDDVEVDFAPVTPGFALLTFEGAIRISEPRKIIPIVGFLDENWKPVPGLFSGIMFGPQRFFVAAELPADAAIAVILFAMDDYSEVPTTWANSDAPNSRVGMFKINRNDLAKQHITKAAEEKLERLALAKQHITKAAEEKLERLAKRYDFDEIESMGLQRLGISRQEFEILLQKKIADIDVRTWRSKNGKQEVKGVFKSYDKRILSILKTDATTETFKYSDLDKGTRLQLSKILKEQREAEKHEGEK